MVESSVCFWNPAKHLDLLAWCPAPSIRQSSVDCGTRRGTAGVRPLRVVCVCVGLSVRHQHTMHGMEVLVMFSISWIPKFARGHIRPLPLPSHGPITVARRLQAQAAGRPYHRQLSFGETESAFVRQSVSWRLELDQS